MTTALDRRARTSRLALLLVLALPGCRGLTLQRPSSPTDAARTVVPSCASDTRPYFAYQVEVPARFVADSVTLAPGAYYPTEARVGDSLSVQFVVDTLGRPERDTFRATNASPELMPALLSAMGTWRFTPARRGRCTVRQLVLTGVARH